MMLPTISAVTDAYTILKSAQKEVYDSSRKLELLKSTLEQNIMLATADGRIQGKNEAERKGAGFALFSSDYLAVDNASLAVQEANFHLTQARTEIEMIQTFIKLGEIMASVEPKKVQG